MNGDVTKVNSKYIKATRKLRFAYVTITALLYEDIE